MQQTAHVHSGAAAQEEVCRQLALLVPTEASLSTEAAAVEQAVVLPQETLLLPEVMEGLLESGLTVLSLVTEAQLAPLPELAALVELAPDN